MLSEVEREVVRRAVRKGDVRYITKWAFAWEPHQGQREWLQAFGPLGWLKVGRREKVAACGIRWGKSESSAVDLLIFALLCPSSTQLITSITLDQARIAFDAAARFSESPRFVKHLEEIRSSPFPKVKLKNGSEIWVRSTAHDCAYIRGHRFHRILVDEAAYLKRSHIEVLRTRLADVGGDLILISTPKGRNHFYEEFVKCRSGAADRYFSLHAPSYQNSYIDHVYLDELKGRMTERMYRQEVLADFVEEEGALFRFSDIQALIDEGLELSPPRQASSLYVHGWDLARKSTWTVGVTLDASREPLQVVEFQRFQGLPWPEVARRIEETYRRYPGKVVIDSTGVGDPVMQFLKIKVEGFVFTPRTKTDLLVNLQHIIERHALKMPFIRELVDELQLYTWDESEEGTWDCIMALALACHGARKGQGVIALGPGRVVR